MGLGLEPHCEPPKTSGAMKTNNFRSSQAIAGSRDDLDLLVRRWTVAWILALVAALLGCARIFASERWETLQAINWVENPSNSPKEIGRAHV
jgi:hypothetical protein